MILTSKTSRERSLECCSPIHYHS